MDLTILTCNYDTPNLIVNLLRSVKTHCKSIPHVIVMNTSKTVGPELLDENEIPYFNYRGGSHGEAVNLGLKKVKTKYVLLVDSDILFLQDYTKAFERFKSSGLALMGKVVGDVGDKKLHPRVEPWYCFIDLNFLKQHKIQFFDRDRSIKAKEESKNLNVPIYDIGSTMLEDVANKGGLVGDVDLSGKYFIHYGGMSWRMQSFDPTKEDTDIDFGGTHPHRILYDIGLKVKTEYMEDTIGLDSIDIKGIFKNG